MGHRIVVQLAWDWMTPRTREAVRGLLAGESLAEASVWADRIRATRRSTGPLHFVNIPVGSASYDSAAVCPGGRCVVSAVAEAAAGLTRPGRPEAERGEALRFLLHFLGDLHQPLHVSDRGDRGGNEVRVVWRGRTTDLHALWDDHLLGAWSLSEGRYLARLRAVLRRMSPAERREAASGSVAGWAMDGNVVAGRVVYRIPAGDVNHPSYIRAAGPVLDLQLTRAGLRLARLLNEAFDPGARPSDD